MVTGKQGAARLALVAAVVGAPLAAPVLAHAADNGQWSAFPSPAADGTARQFFVLEVSPGAVVRDTAVIENSTAVPVRLGLYAADALNTAQGGGFGLKDATREQTGVGSWITLDRTEVVVPAGRRVEVPVTITVPADARPGDQAGGVVTIEAGEKAAPDGTGLLVRRANAIRVYARVAGPLTPHLQVHDVSVGGGRSPVVSYTVTNDGNVRLEPTGTLAVDGLLGRDVARATLSLPEILPGESVTLAEPIAVGAPLDRLDARVDLTAADHPDLEASGTRTTWSGPWLAVLGALALLVLLVAALLTVRRHRSATPTAPAETAVPDRRG